MSIPLSRYNHVFDRISEACSKVGRSPKEITLVGVSKGQSYEKIKPFIELGLKNVGESYYQEAKSKIPKIRELNPATKLHFIGHLQTNKVKKILPLVDLIHSVDSLKLAKVINQRVEQFNLNSTSHQLTSINRIIDPFPVLLQVNYSGEATKAGCAPEEIQFILSEIQDELEHVSCTGLMTIAPINAVTEEKLRAFYKNVAKSRELIRYSFPECRELSSGMSHDFEIAIEKGSTLIRVGTLLFGPRPK